MREIPPGYGGGITRPSDTKPPAAQGWQAAAGGVGIPRESEAAQVVQRSWLPFARQALVSVLSLRGRSHHQPQLNRWCVYRRQVDSPHSQQPPASTPQPRSSSVPPGIASHTESPSGDRDVPRPPCAGASQPGVACPEPAADSGRVQAALTIIPSRETALYAGHREAHNSLCHRTPLR